MEISIIIVNYRSLEKTRKCLEHLLSANWSDLSFEIIVVDNDSKDGSPDKIKDEFPEIKLIKSEKNLGMGGGNNLGIKASNGEYLLVLNPDTYVGKDSIRILYSYLKENIAVGIAGPKILNPDGSLQYTCMRFPILLHPALRRTFIGGAAKDYLTYFLMKDYDHVATAKVDWLMGSCLLIRADILQRIGGAFDERYFMYFEDTDICRRAWLSGFGVAYVPEANVIHDHTRQSAKHRWYVAPFKDKLARAHIVSWLKYFAKWGVKFVRYGI